MLIVCLIIVLCFVVVLIHKLIFLSLIFFLILSVLLCVFINKNVVIKNQSVSEILISYLLLFNSEEAVN